MSKADIALIRASRYDRRMMNTLDLDPEWDAIDLLEEVEKEFDIKIADEEAEQCETVGDLYAVLCAHLPAWDTQSGNCASSMTFYKIRRSLDPDRTQGITPRTALLMPKGPQELFRKLGRETGLRLPSPRQTWVGMGGGLILTVGLLTAIISFFIGLWIVNGCALAVGVLGIVLIWMDRGKLPLGIATIGDLVQRTAPLNARELRDDGGRPSDRWSILVSLASEYGSLTPDQITPETFFHRSSLELATAA